MTKKEVKKAILDYFFCIRDVPMRAVDCDQQQEETLKMKLLKYASENRKPTFRGFGSCQNSE